MRPSGVPRAKKPRTTKEIIYEGYAPHGVALLVECATDNPTRTVGNVRNLFTRNAAIWVLPEA